MSGTATKQAIASTDETTLITCEYDPATGVAWAILHDNPVMAWLIDPTSVEQPQPVILGSLPPAPPDTAPVVSPTWASFTLGTLYVPNTMRGSVSDFFDYVARNNGVERPIYANFADDSLAAAWSNWSLSNQASALKAPPNV